MTPRTFADEMEEITDLAEIFEIGTRPEKASVTNWKRRNAYKTQTEIHRITRGYSLPPGCHEL
jgi:hypothetical protein